MNKPLKRVAFACFALLAALMININYVQAFDADSLKNETGNGRTIIERYQRDRGPIYVGNSKVAYSEATSGTYKYKRVYTNGPLYAPITGMYSLYSTSGVELAENDLLDGTSDKLFVRRLMDQVTGKPPKGASVLTTINKKAQEVAYNGLRNAGKRGAAVALDPRSGKILAMATNPSFDPNAFSSFDGDTLERVSKRLTKDKSQPMLNRTISNTYPPGSTFKVVTSAAALGTGNYTADSVVPAPNSYKPPQTTRSMRNDSGESCGNGSTTSLGHALEMSCNTAYAKLGVKLGSTKMENQAQKFGFGDPDLTVPMPVTRSVFPQGLSPAFLAQASIGQYDTRVTPMQMAMVASGVANDGKVMHPYVVDSVKGADGSTVEKTSPEQYKDAMDADKAHQLTEMMKLVVSGPDGTGHTVAIPGVQVAAKTGTAQNAPGKPPHAWMIAFAPAENPKVAVAVMVESGGKLGGDGYGATLSGPIAQGIMKAVLGQ
jgi:peptidoglycan glycosyltransferase